MNTPRGTVGDKAESVNDRLVQLWKSPEATALREAKLQALHRWPGLHPEGAAAGGLATVGLNPSFRETGMWPGVEGALAKDLGIHPAKYFAWHGATGGEHFRRDLALRVEVAAKKAHHFFSLARRLAERLKVADHGWHHFDMFALREASSPKVLSSCLEGTGLSRFGEQQWELFLEALRNSSPRMVVFFSAEASRIYKAFRPVRDDQAAGCHFDDFGEGPVPVLFGGFPTYMDSFSKARLLWQAEQLWRGTQPGAGAT